MTWRYISYVAAAAAAGAVAAVDVVAVAAASEGHLGIKDADCSGTERRERRESRAWLPAPAQSECPGLHSKQHSPRRRRQLPPVEPVARSVRRGWPPRRSRGSGRTARGPGEPRPASAASVDGDCRLMLPLPPRQQQPQCPGSEVEVSAELLGFPALPPAPRA